MLNGGNDAEVLTSLNPGVVKGILQEKVIGIPELVAHEGKTLLLMRPLCQRLVDSFGRNY